MPEGQRHRPFRAGIDTVLLVLEEEYRDVCRNGSGALSSPLFLRIIRQFRAWERGIPPSRAWAGYSAQNPRLLEAFDRLAQVQAETERERIRR